MSELANIKISGSGSCGGGCYDRISISGSGSVNGDVKCNSISISGSGRIGGNVDCRDRISISGSGSIDGEIICGEFHNSGSAKSSGNITAKSFHVSGVFKSGGWINSDVIAISGIVKAEGDITGERVNIRGGISTEKLVSGDNVVIEFESGCSCRIGELGGGTIRVYRSEKLFRGLFGSLFNTNDSIGTAEIGSIEADDIDISHCNVKSIVGTKVVIGPGCRVERVEYTESLQIDESSKVGETVCNK